MFNYSPSIKALKPMKMRAKISSSSTAVYQGLPHSLYWSSIVKLQRSAGNAIIWFLLWQVNYWLPIMLHMWGSKEVTTYLKSESSKWWNEFQIRTIYNSQTQTISSTLRFFKPKFDLLFPYFLSVYITRCVFMYVYAVCTCGCAWMHMCGGHKPALGNQSSTVGWAYTTSTITCWAILLVLSFPFFIANNSEEAFISQKSTLVLKVEKEPS